MQWSREQCNGDENGKDAEVVTDSTGPLTTRTLYDGYNNSAMNTDGTAGLITKTGKVYASCRCATYCSEVVRGVLNNLDYSWQEAQAAIQNS